MYARAFARVRVLGIASADDSFQYLFTFFGLTLDTSKHQPQATSCVFLGVTEDLGRAASDDIVTCRPKPARSNTILDAIRHARESSSFTAVETASMRGRLIS